jgi:hypothetical protein
MAYVPFNDLTETQRAEATVLRPKWTPEEFSRFQFWVCPGGAISRRVGHHTLTAEEGAKIDAMLRFDVRTKGDLRDYTTARFSLTQG